MKKTQLQAGFEAKDYKGKLLVKVFQPDRIVTWHYKIHEEEKGLMVDFIQTLTRENKELHLDVVTDKYLRRYLFNRTLLDLGLDQDKMAKYVEKNFDAHHYNAEYMFGFDFREMKNLSQRNKDIKVSLPNGFNVSRFPQLYHTEHLPVVVQVDNYDISSSFVDYQNFGTKVVDYVFDKLVNGEVPEMKNDLFNREEVQELITFDDRGNNQMRS